MLKEGQRAPDGVTSFKNNKGQPMLYELNATYMESIKPLNSWAKFVQDFNSAPWNCMRFSTAARTVNASMEFVERLTDCYDEPLGG
ncbi:hypothetical protein [Enterovibrio coralii]|uniref:hypothetical protein n=1 Tax=Enterovibrio coralii TaxID=294935 RepID=UPI000A8F160A|nr:hypothetical protein [Enterovibrio coralii]